MASSDRPSRRAPPSGPPRLGLGGLGLERPRLHSWVSAAGAPRARLQPGLRPGLAARRGPRRSSSPDTVFSGRRVLRYAESPGRRVPRLSGDAARDPADRSEDRLAFGARRPFVSVRTCERGAAPGLACGLSCCPSAGPPAGGLTPAQSPVTSLSTVPPMVLPSVAAPPGRDSTDDAALLGGPSWRSSSPASTPPLERLAAGWFGVLLAGRDRQLRGTRGIIVRGMHAVVSRTKTRWDDVLVQHQRLRAAEPPRPGAGGVRGRSGCCWTDAGEAIYQRLPAAGRQRLDDPRRGADRPRACWTPLVSIGLQREATRIKAGAELRAGGPARGLGRRRDPLGRGPDAEEPDGAAGGAGRDDGGPPAGLPGHHPRLHRQHPASSPTRCCASATGSRCPSTAPTAT